MKTHPPFAETMPHPAKAQLSATAALLFAGLAMLPAIVHFTWPNGAMLACGGPLLAGVALAVELPGSRFAGIVLGAVAGLSLLAVNWLVAVEGGCCATLR